MRRKLYLALSPCFCWPWHIPRILIFHDGGGGGGLLNNFALIRRPLLGDFRHEIDTPSQSSLTQSLVCVCVCPLMQTLWCSRPLVLLSLRLGSGVNVEMWKQRARSRRSLSCRVFAVEVCASARSPPHLLWPVWNRCGREVFAKTTKFSIVLWYRHC